MKGTVGLFIGLSHMHDSIYAVIGLNLRGIYATGITDKAQNGQVGAIDRINCNAANPYEHGV